MATDPSIIVKDLLVAEGVGDYDGIVTGDETGWHVFIGHEPTDPAACITIYASGGATASPKFLLDFPSVQIRVRGEMGGYESARDKMMQIRDVLLGRDTYYHSSGDVVDMINLMSDIIQLPTNETGQPLFVVNFQLTVEPAPSPGSNREPL